MPIIRELRDGTFSTCQAGAPRSFVVSYDSWADWLALGPRPTTPGGLRLRPYGAMDVVSHPPYAPDGIYVDHRDPRVEAAAYELRDRLLREQAGASQATLEPLAQEFGLRHWRDAYNTVRNVGRRITGESGRDSDGELRWRRWNQPRNMRQTPAAPARPGARGDGSLVTRRFGIEIEFNGYNTRDRIVAELSAGGAEVAGEVLDVARASACRDAVARAVARFSRLDVLCNIAGVLKTGHLADITAMDWQRLVDVNLSGVFLNSQWANHVD